MPVGKPSFYDGSKPFCIARRARYRGSRRGQAGVSEVLDRDRRPPCFGQARSDVRSQGQGRGSTRSSVSPEGRRLAMPIKRTSSTPATRRPTGSRLGGWIGGRPPKRQTTLPQFRLVPSLFTAWRIDAQSLRFIMPPALFVDCPYPMPASTCLATFRCLEPCRTAGHRRFLKDSRGQ